MSRMENSGSKCTWYKIVIRAKKNLQNQKKCYYGL